MADLIDTFNVAASGLTAERARLGQPAPARAAATAATAATPAPTAAPAAGGT